jgi:hypothetical protein
MAESGRKRNPLEGAMHDPACTVARSIIIVIPIAYRPNALPDRSRIVFHAKLRFYRARMSIRAWLVRRVYRARQFSGDGARGSPQEEFSHAFHVHR